MALQSNHRGLAGSAHDCVSEPFAVISQQPILSGLVDDTKNYTWLELANAKRTSDVAEYKEQLRTKRMFAIGGLGLVVKCGLAVEWYRNDANREEALQLIRQRGVEDQLSEIADKDEKIFGKNALRPFFRTFPSVHRESASKGKASDVSARSIRKQHPLRLRKAIEFLFLTEAVLRWRFSIDESKQRFERVTGIKVIGPEDAQHIWGYMWIEPLNFVLDTDPRGPDIDRIVSTPEVAAAFSEQSGQYPEVLGSILSGVPGSHDTVEAASIACNSFYGEHSAQTAAMTATPKCYDNGMKLLDRLPSDDIMPRLVENVVKLTPDAA